MPVREGRIRRHGRNRDSRNGYAHDSVPDLRVQALPESERLPAGLHEFQPARARRINLQMKVENSGSCAHCKAGLEGLRIDARYCGSRCRILATKQRRRIRTGAFIAGTERECLECRSKFLAMFNRHAYCKDSCASAAYQRRVGGTKNRNCEICNTEFTPNSSMHRLCSKACIRVRQRHQRLAAMYGLTAEAYEELLSRQGGCAICQAKESDRWAVDHDHSCCNGDITCGKCIRGILCFPCNQALGLLKDSPENLKRALSYLTDSNDPGQPGSVYGVPREPKL